MPSFGNFLCSGIRPVVGRIRPEVPDDYGEVDGSLGYWRDGREAATLAELSQTAC